MKTYLLAAAALFVAATPVAAQEGANSDPSVSTGFSGIYVGASGGYDVQPNDGSATILFDRNLDGRFGDTVLTGTGANAFAPGFCGGRAVAGLPYCGHHCRIAYQPAAERRRLRA